MLADPVCALLLERLPRLGLPDWWLAAGAVFQNVWNALEGKPAGYGIKDYDVIYVDDRDLSWEAEDRVIRAAATLVPEVPAETVQLRNQARVHLWYEDRFGVPCAPIGGAEEALRRYASTTCSVAITKDDSGFRVLAPYGLRDTFAMVMRPHRAQAPREVYERKARDYARRWPSLIYEPWAAAPTS